MGKDWDLLLSAMLTNAIETSTGKLVVTLGGKNGVAVSWNGNQAGLLIAAHAAVKSISEETKQDFKEMLKLVEMFEEFTNSKIVHCESTEQMDAMSELLKKFEP